MITTDTLMWIALGVILGWQFPQPAWAKFMFDKVKAYFSKPQ